MAYLPDCLAIVFDFDDTLLPDSTTLLLEKHQIDPRNFWGKEVKNLIDLGFDPPHAYLRQLLKNIGKGKPLGLLTNQELRKFGKSLESFFFPGVKTIFKDLRAIVAQSTNIQIEFYIISGGLQDLIEGNDFIRENMSGIYGCKLGGDTEDGPLKYIKRCITFTEKTRFLFEINKGVKPSDTQTKPYLVNEDIPKEKRRIPFKNMVYIGDGMTDIPCFSLLKNFGGTPFGVFKPTTDSAKRGLLEFLNPHRVISMHTPKYRKSDDFGLMLRAAVSTLCGRITVERGQAETLS